MSFTLRPYQRQALDALDAYWAAGGGNALISMATATGKSVVIAQLVRDVLERFPNLRILVVTHVQELIEQNLNHLIKLWPDAPVGINSAALGRRDCEHRIIFGSIQSMFRNPRALGSCDLVLIDECHLVPHAGNGMYRTLLAALRDSVPDLRVAGFSATCFRLDSGRLDEGEGKIFDDIVFEYDIAQGIRDGYLSPLTSKATRTRIDVSGVGRRGGDFIESELQDAVDTETIVNGACDEIVKLGADRRSWLIFCTGIRHAEHVRDALRARGVNAEAVFGETATEERERIVRAFKAGTITALANVGVLTTGFNAPATDMLVMLRPTLSAGLYVQMVGRGSRKTEGKTDTLIADFAQNVHRHGPVDRVSINNIKTKNDAAVKPDTVRARVCPQCQEINPLDAAACSCCGFEWPKPAPKPKHATIADAVPVLSTGQSWMPVTNTMFFHHIKRSDPSAPPTLRVSYLAGLVTSYDEYICFEHLGYARTRAEKWWFALGGMAPVPATVMEAIQRSGELGRVVEIAVYRNDRWWNVSDRRVLRSDGTLVEIDRYFTSWVAKSRESAFQEIKREPFGDEVRF
jgi:DNA repair protein RadD